ncbi:MAG: hypothetical protein COA32_04215 [Fluviicola sp.]|nr:MAG: hypothetical protein COA32_04215 [Fluviicola sp.]
MRIIFSILLALSLTLPLFKVQNNNSTETAIEYLKDQLLDSNWGTIANQAIKFSEKVLEEKKEPKKGLFPALKYNIVTGYGIGFSSIGAIEVALNNYRFDRYDLVPIIPLFIIIATLLQLIYHQSLYRNRNSILSIINMLLTLSVYGNCIGHENYSGYLLGIIIFMLIQTSYMIYFYWFPYNKVIVENDGNQSS